MVRDDVNAEEALRMASNAGEMARGLVRLDLRRLIAAAAPEAKTRPAR